MKQVLKIKICVDKLIQIKKCMTIVCGLPGVESVSLDQNKALIVEGDGVDAAFMVAELRKKVGFAELLSVEAWEKNKKEPTKEEKEEQPEKPNEWNFHSSFCELPFLPKSHNRHKVLTEIPKDLEWNAQEIHAIFDELSVLPESPNCPFLVELSLEGSYALTAIPSSFFEHMPALQLLDLSHTSIKSLPVSLPKLVALKTLLLINCELLMELPPGVGELHNLEKLDLYETQILYLPREIGKLSKLEFLRVSFYGYMNGRLQQNGLIHPGTISALSQLNDLSIDVDPADERWNEAVEVVMGETSSLEKLESLILFLPNVEILEKYRIASKSLGYYSLLSFGFTVGQRKQRMISRVPAEVKADFQGWDKCLKYVEGKDIPSEMKRVLKCTEAFYLDRHATATSLCDFGIKNMQELEFCLLVECNKIQNIISGLESLEEQADMLVQNPKNSESGGALLSAEEPALVNLHYLHIYYLKNLVSIWRTPTNYKQCLSGLKFLALHMCPKLSVIFCPALLANLGKLEVLIVKDCPEVTRVVSLTRNESVDPQLLYLPSLKKISLLYLPKLISISSGFRIAASLEKVGFYNCPKLESLSRREMSSESLQVITGERKWWEALKWNKLEWGSRLDYIQSIFSPITMEKDVMTQMEAISRIPSSHQTRMSNSSYSWMGSAGKSPLVSSFGASQTTTLPSDDEPVACVCI